MDDEGRRVLSALPPKSHGYGQSPKSSDGTDTIGCAERLILTRKHRLWVNLLGHQECPHYSQEYFARKNRHGLFEENGYQAQPRAGANAVVSLNPQRKTRVPSAHSSRWASTKSSFFRMDCERNVLMITLSNGYRFEAEELSLSGFRVESSSTAGASSDAFIATRHSSGATGNAAGTFVGDADTYRVEVGYYDENDGQSLATVTVDGQATQFRFDQNLGGSGAAVDTHATRVTHQTVELQSGDRFSVSGRANGSEYARFDYIDFIRLDDVDPPAPPPDSAGRRGR